jgi:hypothetical protein
MTRHREVAGRLPYGEELIKGLSSWHSSWGSNASDGQRAIEAIADGSLRYIAAELTHNRLQAGHGYEEILKGINRWDNRGSAYAARR